MVNDTDAHDDGCNSSGEVTTSSSGKEVFSPTVRPQCILVVGSGVVGLWQAYLHARKGHDVRLVSEAPLAHPASNPTAGASYNPFGRAASWWAAGMLAPDCEAEIAEPTVVSLGRRALPLWQAAYPEVVANGSLVLAAPRDTADLKRFSRVTTHHHWCLAEEIAKLEPDLADRFRTGLFFPDEAHMSSRDALHHLRNALLDMGVTILSQRVPDVIAQEMQDFCEADAIIDARGLGARTQIKRLRGVRGEMAVLRTDDIKLSRPVRLLHPRIPLYIVPWGEGRYMVGSTVIEREDDGPVSARSALEILSAAYTVHPAFGEAEVLEFGTGVRPAFPDNTPRVVRDGRIFHVNGMYRHGFLTAPALAADVALKIEANEHTA